MMLPSCPRRIANGGGRRTPSPDVASDAPSVFRETAASAAPGAHSWTSLKMVPPATRRSAMRLPRSASEYNMERCEHSTRRSNAGGEEAAENASAPPKDHCSTALSARPTATVVSASAWASGRIGRASCTQCPSGGSARVTRSSRASGATPAPARSVATATLRSPQTRIARPPLAPDALATNASRSGEGRMPCTRADGNTVVESKGTSPPALKGSYHFRLAPVPASRVSCARGLAPSDAGSAASASSPVGGSAQSAVTSPTYTPRVSRRGDDIAGSRRSASRSARRAQPRTLPARVWRFGAAFGAFSHFFEQLPRKKSWLDPRSAKKRGGPFSLRESGVHRPGRLASTETERENMPRRWSTHGRRSSSLFSAFSRIDVSARAPFPGHNPTHAHQHALVDPTSHSSCRFPSQCRAGRARRAAASTSPRP